VGACIGAGLVGGEGFAVDASLIAADVNKQRSTPGAQWNKELDVEAPIRAAFSKLWENQLAVPSRRFIAQII
jgi:hypothetical protein